MGTSKSGRYLNTRGSGRSVSDFALVHSNEGTFRWRQTHIHGKPAKQIRLNGGGHGQKGMDLLNKYHIKYQVVKTFPNGVCVGYVPDHVQKSKRSGTGQSWFPATWTERDIKRAEEHVASLKHNRHVKDGVPVYGTYKGVRVGVIHTHGKVSTVFPDGNQPSSRRKYK